MDKVIELLKKSGVDTGSGRWVYDEFEANLDQLNEFYTLARADLEAEIEILHTTIMAAAVEIQEQWEHHCDAEGYGPANLMHRLECGIASKYGYDAKTMVRMDKRIEDLEAELLEQARVNGMGGERELKLMADLAATRDLAEGYAQERNELKAENAKLKAALQRCKDEAGVPENVWKAARAALGEK